MASKLVRQSKYKHTVGKVEKKDNWYADISPANSSQDGAQLIAASALFVATVWSTAGGYDPELQFLLRNNDGAHKGSVGILPLSATGKRVGAVPLIQAHSAEIQDLAFSPHDDHLLATSSDDATLRIWKLPDAGLTANTSDPAASLSGHGKRVDVLQWHPSAGQVVASGSTDGTVRLWDVAKAESKVSVTIGDVLQGISWDYEGNVIAAVSKDRKLRLVDPRKGATVAEVAAHQGVKPMKITFASQSNKILTTGFSKQRERQLSVWDPRSMTAAVSTTQLDSNTGVLFPFYDHDTSILLLSGKGDGHVRMFEVVDDKQGLYELPVASDATHRSVCVVPKRGLDVMVLRMLKLTSNAVIPVSFAVPRKMKAEWSDVEELFPNTAWCASALTAEQWFGGESKAPQLHSLDPAKRAAPTVAIAAPQKIEVKSSLQQEKLEIVGSNQDKEEKTSGSASTNTDRPMPAALAAAAPPSMNSEVSAPIKKATAKQVQVVRSSHFRHISGSIKKPQTFESLRPNPNCDRQLRTNGKFFAVPWQGAGGRLLLMPLSAPGRLSDQVKTLETGSGVSDFDFALYSEHLATAGEDARVRLWQLSADNYKGTDNVRVAQVELSGHSRKVTQLAWHPSAANVLLSTGTDQTVRVWDIESKEAKLCYKDVADLPQSVAWNGLGSLIALATRDRKLHIIDPRQEKSVGTTDGQQGAKGVNLTWLSADTVLSAGFSKTSERELCMWDTRQFSAPITTVSIDSASGLFEPFFDEDTSVLFIGAKGDTSVRFYEVVKDAPYIHQLGAYTSTSPQVGLAALPKRQLDVTNVEIFSMLKLTASNAVETLSFRVPRTRTEFFQDDVQFNHLHMTDRSQLFPPTRGAAPALTATEWFGGANKTVERVSLKPANLVALSAAPADQRGPKKFEPEVLRGEEETTKEQVASAVFAAISAVAKENDVSADKSTGGGIENPAEWDD